MTHKMLSRLQWKECAARMMLLCIRVILCRNGLVQVGSVVELIGSFPNFLGSTSHGAHSFMKQLFEFEFSVSATALASIGNQKVFDKHFTI